LTKFKLKNFDGRLYLKSELREILGHNENVYGLANAKTIVLFPEGATWDEILESLNILIRDIELRKKTGEAIDVVKE